MPRKKPVINSKNPSGLDDRQEKFCREYLVDFNAARAARTAGYSERTARQQGTDLLTRPAIQQYIKGLAEKVMVETGDPVKRIVMELQMIAFGDLKDIVEWDKWSMTYKPSRDLGDKTRMIQEISESHTSTGGSRKIKLYDKLRALEMLSKYYGLFKDETNVNVNVKTKVVIRMIPNGREKIAAPEKNANIPDAEIL